MHTRKRLDRYRHHRDLVIEIVVSGDLELLFSYALDADARRHQRIDDNRVGVTCLDLVIGGALFGGTAEVEELGEIIGAPIDLFLRLAARIPKLRFDVDVRYKASF